MLRYRVAGIVIAVTTAFFAPVLAPVAAAELGAFVESAGLVVFEAEHYATKADGSGDSWTEITDPTGFTGDAAMESGPDDGTRLRGDLAGLSPEMSFDIDIVTTGTYHAWVRTWAPDVRGKASFVGLDGVQASDGIAAGGSGAWSDGVGEWSWSNSGRTGAAVAIEVATTGLHTFHVWMGDDGIIVDKIVLTTDAGFVPEGDGPPESMRGGDGPVPPTASFGATCVDLACDFADTSTDGDGSVVSWDWGFGDGAVSTMQHPSHSYASSGTYTVTLTVTDDDGDTDSTTADVTVIDPGSGGDGAFLEVGGVVVFEAEHYTLLTDRSGDGWTELTSIAGFSGDSAMASGPDDGTRLRQDLPNVAPEMSYDIEVTTTGTYYVWFRTWAPDRNGKASFVGLDGIPAADGIAAGGGGWAAGIGEWSWSNTGRPGTSVTIEVTTPGLHSVQVWMGDDGIIVDKVVLTTDAAFVPTDEGPPESPRS